MEFRDNLLVTAGARAAYMHDRGDIELPSGVEGEEIVAEFVTHIVNQYISKQSVYGNFDNYIEIALTKQYGVIKKEIPKEVDISEFDKLTVCMSSMLDELKKVIKRPDGFVDSANYALYKSIQYLELQILELDRRTR